MESEGRLPRNDKEEQQRRADALENWEQDPNSSVLLDLQHCVDGFAEAGTSRASRQQLKCPIPGCQVPRAS